MMKQQLPNPRRRGIETLIHIIVWGIVIGFPFLMMTRSGFNISLADYLRHGSSSTLSFFLVFYINYCLLIPRYLFEGRIRQYLLLNTLLIICITTGAHLWQEYTFQNHMRGDDDGQHMGPPKWIFILRDISTMILTAGLSAAIKLSRRWAQMDAARREAEKSRTEAELKNLRNQLNPHFLLNTLNNIYALIAFDADKAQTAVQELSRLLRHVLYDNQQNFVTLDKEMDFIRNYIELMRPRPPAPARAAPPPAAPAALRPPGPGDGRPPHLPLPDSPPPLRPRPRGTNDRRPTGQPYGNSSAHLYFPHRECLQAWHLPH